MTFIVFQDTLSGFKLIPQFTSENLPEAKQCITEGTIGLHCPSQNFMYYIYKAYDTNVPLLGLKFEVYEFVQSVAGRFVENPQKHAHKYALTHNSSMAWFFSDNMFE